KLAACGRGGGGIPRCGPMFNRRASLVAQMLEQKVGNLAARAAAARSQGFLMLAPRLGPALSLSREHCGGADAANPARKNHIGRAQGVVAGGRDDTLVDALVDPEITVHVAVEIAAVHLVMQPLDVSDLLIRDSLAGQAPG